MEDFQGSFGSRSAAGLRCLIATAVGVGLLAYSALAGAQHAEVPAPAAEAAEAAPAAPAFTPLAYAEVYYQWNFRNPSNGITDFRGFDNRHNTFTISNVALGGSWDVENVVGTVALQVGHTPDTYYLAETATPGGTSSNASDRDLWKYVQQAFVGYRFETSDREGGNPLLVSAGLFLSPIGPEGIAVKDNWNWSRSNLFYGLPFYHTGARVTYSFNDEWAGTLAVYNGWNTVVDNNDEKSVSAQVTYTKADALALSLLYFGGIERPEDAPEGRAWRHLYDAHATITATDWLSLLVHADAGFEPNDSGTSSWVAGALAARFKVAEPLYLAARADAFYEHAGESEVQTAGRIFWPGDWVTSQTATVDVRPHDHVSFRLEYRHDQGDAEMFFRGDVEGDGITTPYVADETAQDTITLGVTAWY
jgi:hypothetical protein